MSANADQFNDALRSRIDLWQADLRDISTQIEALNASRTEIEQRLHAALLLVDDLPPPVPAQLETTDAVAPAPVVVPKSVKVAPRVKKRRTSASSAWQNAVEAIVKPADMGLTFAELREGLMRTPLGDKLAASAKGYHNALSKLDATGKIKRKYGRVFTPAAFERFERAVHEGTASPVAPQPLVHSPMGEAILKIVGAHSGVLSKQVIVELRRNSEFNAALTPHQTGAFNIIARLVKRRQIVRRDDGGLEAGPDFPKELIRLSPDVVGAPNGNAIGAPKTDRDYPSLPFPQPATVRH